MQFSELNLAKRILDAVAQEGYETPTPIQAKSIPPVIAGRDILGCAQTGTGKTAAFALPILHKLHTAQRDKSQRGPVKPRTLVLSPTRELAGQIDESFTTYGKYTNLRQTVIYGGVKQFRQVRQIQRGVDILVATPGRLIDLMQQKIIDLRCIEIFVLDEADRMLDMGFIEPIRQISRAIPKKPQTLLFSATMPKEIRHLADSLLRNPVQITVDPVASTTPLIEQSVCMVPQESKAALLTHMLSDKSIRRALVFTKTKHGADKLTRKLNDANMRATAIHGDKPQRQRQRALDSFREGKARVLVATDVAARGLDVDNITHVFNFDLPMEPEAYVHRIGRTGRAGATGIAIAFCDRKERKHLRAIEGLTGKRLDAIQGPPEITPVEPDGQRQEEYKPKPKFKANRSRKSNADNTPSPIRRQRTAKPKHQNASGKPARAGSQRTATGPRKRRSTRSR